MQCILYTYISSCDTYLSPTKRNFSVVPSLLSRTSQAEAAQAAQFKPPVQQIQPPPIPTAAPIMEALSPMPLELAAVAKLAAEGLGDVGNLTNLNEELTQEATDEFADAASAAALTAQISSSEETPPNAANANPKATMTSSSSSSSIAAKPSTSLTKVTRSTRSSTTSLLGPKETPASLVVTHVFGLNKPTLQSSNIKIFKHLNNEDLINAGLVSKGFKNIAFDENLWSL